MTAMHARDCICFVGKAPYRRIRDHEDDVRTMRAIGAGTHRVYMITMSASGRDVVSHAGEVVLVALRCPKHPVLKHLTFIARAAALGYRLARTRNIATFSASEPPGGGMVCVALRALTGRPFLLQLQGQLLNLTASTTSRPRALITRWTTILVARAAAKVRCVSRGLVEEARQAGIPEDKLVLVTSRVDVNRFDPARFAEEGAAIRRAHGAEGRVVLMAVARLVIHKGLQYLIDALPTVLARHPDALLILVGSGDQEEFLRQRAAEKGVAAAVVFAGAAPHSRVPAFLAAADVFVLSSPDEGMPRSVLEAMSMSRCVVATRVGGVPEIVIDGETGVLVPPRDPEGLAAGILSVLADPGRTKSMGEKGRAHVVAHYRFEDNTKRFRELLLGVAAGGSARPVEEASHG